MNLKFNIEIHKKHGAIATPCFLCNHYFLYL